MTAAESLPQTLFPCQDSVTTRMPVQSKLNNIQQGDSFNNRRHLPTPTPPLFPPRCSPIKGTAANDHTNAWPSAVWAPQWKLRFLCSDIHIKSSVVFSNSTPDRAATDRCTWHMRESGQLHASCDRAIPLATQCYRSGMQGRVDISGTTYPQGSNNSSP